MLNYRLIRFLGFGRAALFATATGNFRGYRATRTLATALLLVCGLALTARAADELPITARVMKITGKARFSPDQKHWQALKKNQVLKDGAFVQTGGKSWVDLELGAKATASTANLARVLDDSVLVIEKLSAAPNGVQSALETRLDLRAGQIMGTVKGLPPGSTYEIKYPGGYVGVIGGSYWLSSSGVVSVTDGTVVIAWILPNGNATHKVVTAGQRFDPNTGM